MRGLAELEASHPPATRRTLLAELEHLERQAAIDCASVERVGGSGVLAEAPAWRLQRARGVELRDGWAAFATRATVERWRVRVLSVNWSTAFIAEALNNTLPGIPIDANDIEPDGRIVGGLHSCGDKRRRLRELRGADDVVVYVGDSPGDLGALHDADVAIVMSDRLLPTLGRVGQAVASCDDASRDAWHLARDWHDVARCLEAVGGR